MTITSRNRTKRPSHPPLWLVEGLDIVDRKRWLLGAVVLVVVALSALASLVFPATVPPTAGVGAAVGVAALLLGLAAAVASDATELIVRGPRHVAAAGGELVAVVPRDPTVAAAGPLAAAIEEVREPGSPLLLAFATAGRDARRTVAWTDAIARSLVKRNLGVLRVDLASGRSEEEGLVEVVRDDLRLADVVEFEPEVKLARLRAGRDHGEALAALTELPARLPRDLDILLVSLPTAVSRPVVTAAAALDHVLVVVERDRTSRVDLIASLDALEAAGTDAQVVLLDTSTALRLAPPVEVAPDQEQTKRGIASTVGTPPKVVPGVDEQPVEVGDALVEVQDVHGQELDESVADGPDEGVEEVPDDLAPAGVEHHLDDRAAPGAEHHPHDDPDDQPDAGAPRRDVELLEAAAAATAVSLTEAEQEPLDERFDAPVEDTPAAPEELPRPQEEPRLEGPVELTPVESTPEPASGSVDRDGQDDTDRIPRAAGPGRPRLDRVDPAEEDLLRTTARLAMLSGEIDLRDDAPASSGPGSAQRAEVDDGASPEEATDRDDHEAR